MPTRSGIYIITNLHNGKMYVGQSVNIAARVHFHECSFDYKESPAYKKMLYAAIRKYGITAFRADVLEECKESELDSRERYWIQKLCTCVQDKNSNGYNISRGGKSGDVLALPEVQKAALEKHRQSKKGNGENHPAAKLTNNEVYAIRQRFLDGEPAGSIYLDYKSLYPITSFKEVLYGYKYKNVGNIPSHEYIKSMSKESKIGGNNAAAKISDSDVISIRKRYVAGESAEDIYKDYANIYHNINIFRMIPYCRSYKYTGTPALREACIKKHKSEMNIAKSGVNHSNARLTETEVRDIRTRYSNGESLTSIYKDYKDKYSCANNLRKVAKGISYKYIS